MNVRIAAYDSRRNMGQIYYRTGIRDTKGREIGGRLMLAEINVVEIETDHAWIGLPLNEPGSYYTATPHATRDGKDFGPLQATLFFKTPSDRAAYIERYCRSVQRRAAQKEKKL